MIRLRPEVIQAHHAREVLYTFGETGGYAPGSFTTALIEAIRAADHVNQGKLAMQFPSEVNAVRMAMDGDFDTLRTIASGQRASTH